MHLLIANDNYDKSFVEKHCNFRGAEADTPTLQGEAISEEEFRKRIAKYTPVHVEELSGVAWLSHGEDV